MVSKKGKRLGRKQSTGDSLINRISSNPQPYVVSGVLLCFMLGIIISNLLDSSEKSEVIVYKTTTCGCCGVYVEMMEDDGWEVEVRNVGDIETIMNEYQIPDDKRSCHLSLVEGYYVVGHVPFEIINQLLEEKPDIDGISLPGMPAGSPGMGGEKSETWTIYSIKDGKSEVFAEY
tara:strand:+ start:958 stop:1482 length:525 start_codon:yes stop_codon:yes gene_type:complete